MALKDRENLKMVRFNGQMLPIWAQLLDVAARTCRIEDEAQSWFSRFTRTNGVDDSQVVLAHCWALSNAIREQKEAIILDLQRSTRDDQPLATLAAWKYALETMIQEASSTKTCCWTVEGSREPGDEQSDGGDITLRRV
jgi:hypothetical protein